MVVLGGCTGATVKETHADLDARLEECARESGYHPHRYTGADTGLAPGEPQFLQCAYTLVERVVIPRTAFPDDYRELVARHREMTTAVAAGTLTRQERRARTEAMMDAIEARELQSEVERRKRMDELQQRMMEEQRQLELQEHIRRMHRRPVERALLGR